METKKIVVNVCLPVDVELDVVWDEDDEAAEIKGVSLKPIQMGFSPRSISEHLSEDDLQLIDDETRRVFGADALDKLTEGERERIRQPGPWPREILEKLTDAEREHLGLDDVPF